MQVTAAGKLTAIKKALKKGGNKQFLVKELAGLNHLFQTAETGAESEYNKIEETFSPIAMELIAEWLDKIVK